MISQLKNVGFWHKSDICFDENSRLSHKRDVMAYE